MKLITQSYKPSKELIKRLQNLRSRIYVGSRSKIEKNEIVFLVESCRELLPRGSKTEGIRLLMREMHILGASYYNWKRACENYEKSGTASNL